ncbi:enoyl-CoA hydratase/isomerase family protein [Desulfosporosinus shakirovi]|uniref:enoyl-CoA hydratase/isomerase family protein n=1 Tax=Desulfosporosinus shakirovi TaxID=2885154 RepID=UPI001E581F79|nr:enoyl-CoA hydratase-related protein [Desulfosporosinus sp. SRJS8]MCB8817115.1 enoyl-CoA hydratase/isomerase family protein [Desulfosporosinus sp. SRJS8]
MGTYRNLILENREGILLVTINRAEVRNALNWETWEDIGQLAKEINNDESVKVVIITGAGDKAFAAGADLRWLLERPSIEALEPGVQGVLTELENTIKPIIAAVNGFALGGGCELAMACDLRVSSEGGKFGLVEPTVGILPGGGGTQRLPRLVGKGKAKELIFTGEVIDAVEAERIGLVNKVVPHDQLLVASFEMAKKITAKAPLAIRMAKKVIDMGMATDFPTGLALEKLSQAFLNGTSDRTEGMTAFLEKRKPNFQGK